jgi:nucleoside-diphosphate-sugar epimerase
MKVIIIGEAGKTSQQLISRLESEGNSVVLVDSYEDISIEDRKSIKEEAVILERVFEIRNTHRIAEEFHYPTIAYENSNLRTTSKKHKGANNPFKYRR